MCINISFFVFMYYIFSLYHFDLMQSIFFVLLTISFVVKAYRAELKRREENDGYQIYQPSKLEKITGHATPAFYILLAVGNLVLGVLIFFRAF